MSTSMSAGRGPLRHLVRQMLELKKSWNLHPEPEPDDPQFQSCMDEFKKLSSLTEINLVNCDLGDALIGVIGRAMEEVPFLDLKNLELGGNSISAKGILAIARAMKAGHLPALECLGLCPPFAPDERHKFVAWSRNHIGDEGVAILASAFAVGHGANLKVLNLELNRIGPRGARCLAEAIQEDHLPLLEILNLSYTIVGDEGTLALAKAFETSGKPNSLQVLNLERCNIGMVGTQALASALDSGCLMELTALYLGMNNTSTSTTGLLWQDPRDPTNPTDKGLIQLAKVLQEGHLPKLQTLDLTDNAGGKKSAEAFRDALRKNKTLVVELKINWPSFVTYSSSAKRQMERNRRIALALSQLRGEDDVQATYGKVFLCGNPRVGKTTVRKSLLKDSPFHFFLRERKPLNHEEPPTRGIEVSYMESKGDKNEPPVRVAIWDLAGQTEYQVLHSAFLPDLALADGEATTFVIVCNAEYDIPQSREVLQNWMRFIASSSLKGVDGGKRHVLLVLNCFDNKRCEYPDFWTECLDQLHDTFNDYLEIEKQPFIVDARVAWEVRGLKKHLIRITRTRLINKKVPKICQYILNNLSNSTIDFPVITWNLFATRFQSSVSDELKLKAAVDYLHESGHLIHFRDGSLLEGVDPGRSLVVLDPDWFCKKVVGNLLLPDRLRIEDEIPLKRSLHPDGSLALTELHRHFRHLLQSNHQVQDIVALLFRLGICYKVGIDKVLIPSLIEEATQPAGLWGPNGSQTVTDQWVMGYCLKVEYRETTLLPIAVFCRLQVELAQDALCSSADSEYRVSKFNITFNYDGMAVLVELTVIGQDLQDRIDILVRPLVDREHERFAEKRREKQVDLAQRIEEKFVSLAENWSPGVEFVRAVVRPWSTAEGTYPAGQRFVAMSVSDVKQRVQEQGLDATMSWTVGAELVKAIELLSANELQEWRQSVEHQCADVEDVIVKLGLVPEKEDNSRENFGELLEPLAVQVPDQTASSTEMQELFNLIHRLGQHMDNRFDHLDSGVDELLETMQDVRKELRLALRRQKKILESLQALERFSVQEKEKSVPRFMYLTKADGSGVWMKMQQTIVERATLHFLCEAHFNDHYHSLHEVKDQEGLEIRNLKEWAEKIAPWVEWSLKLAFVVGKVASQAVLPGLAQVIQGFPGGHLQTVGDVGTGIAYGISAFLVAGAETYSNGGLDTSSLRSSTPSRPFEAKDGLKGVLKNLIGELGPEKFLKAFKLKRVVLNRSGYVAWICTDCYSQYNSLGAVQLLD